MQLLEIPIGLHFPSLLFEKIGTCMSLKHVLPTHSDAQQQKNENAIGSNYFHPRFGERDYKSPDFASAGYITPREMYQGQIAQDAGETGAAQSAFLIARERAAAKAAPKASVPQVIGSSKKPL